MAGSTNTFARSFARQATKFSRLLVKLRATKADSADYGDYAATPMAVIQLPPGQTGNALEVQDYAGNVLSAIDSNGALSVQNAPTTAPVGVYQYVDVSITNAQIKALRATPKTLVAAPGAGRMLSFVSAQLVNLGGTNALTESADNLAVKYTDGSGVQVSQDIETTGWLDQTAATVTGALAKIDPIVAAASCANKALVLHNTGDGEYGGNAALDVTFKVRVIYRVFATA